jgi:hypothetical protein
LVNQGDCSHDGKQGTGALPALEIGVPERFSFNWLFADTVKGARASAMLYSIVSTARANGLEPYAYLRRLFAQLPKAKTVEDFEALLPFSNLSDKAISNT